MAEATISWARPHVLRAVRERLNLTPEDVEKEARKLARRGYDPVSAEQIRAWEAGKETPTFEQLATLAEVYICPLGYFFFDELPPEELPLSFRGLKRTKQASLTPLTNRSLRRFLELAEWIGEMAAKFETRHERRISPQMYSSDLDRVSEIVHAEQQRLSWPQAVQFIRSNFMSDREKAFDWVRRTIEEQGIFCIALPLDPSDVRGASFWLRDQYAFILVNSRDAEAATGRIFTLLHEYAHLITEREGLACDFHVEERPGVETFANRFAARFLVSHDELRQVLQTLGLNRFRETWSDYMLDRIRERFLVSRDVIAITLQEMGLAPSNFYERKRQEWEMRRRQVWGWPRGRPRTLNERKLAQIGYSAAKLLREAAEHPDFPWLDTALTLEVKVERLEGFLKWISQEIRMH